MRTPTLLAATLAAALLPSAALAQPAAPATDDGYCAHVEGAAAAESALLLAPAVFGSFGYADQPLVAAAPGSTASDLRLTVGVRYALIGAYEGVLTRGRARADCRRHQALSQVTASTTYRALTARAGVLDAALAEATRLLDEADADLASRRASAPDVVATRLRVDELRGLAAATRRELSAMPPPPSGAMTGALASYHAADAELERHEGRLRRTKAFDLSVRAGYDKFLDGDDESPYFAVVSFGVNLGALLQGSGNARSAAGRRRMAQGGGGALELTLSRVREVLAIQRERADQTGVIVGDLDRQLAALRTMGGESGRRLRQTLWFEWVKANAEHAYLVAHVASLREILGEEAP